MTITEQIKNKLNIIEIIQEYVQLKKIGASYKALCPFHNEKTPSFIVSEDKQIWHCFGCNLGGDVFGFIKQYEGLEFPEVLRILAKRAGIKLERQNPELQNKRTKILDILKLAAEFYHQTLLRSKIAVPARNYLQKRQITDLTIDEFKLGYIAAGWQTIITFLKKRGYKEQEILDSGLAVSKIATSSQIYRQSNLITYDRFRERIIFPIWDIYGNIIGFGGRILSTDQKIAKYINTSETIVYRKSSILYGINKAKQAIRQENLAIIVEGYMDVISSHQAGVKNVVAVSGTALTVEQLNLLKRYTNNIALAFDFDSAGIKAALRSYELALELGLNIKVVQLSVAEENIYKFPFQDIKIDPDDLIKKDPQLWRKAIKTAIDVMDYYFYATLRDLDLDKLSDKRKAASILLQAIAKINEPVTVSHYLEKLAGLIKVSEQDLRQVLEKHKIKKKENLNQNKFAKNNKLLSSMPANKLYNDFLLEYLLALILKFKSYVFLEQLNIEEPALFKDIKIFALYKALKKDYNNIEKKLFDNFNQFQDLLSKLELLADKEFSLLSGEEAQKEMKRLTENLNKNVLKFQIKKLTLTLKSLENNNSNNNEKEILKLSKKIQELNRRLI